MRIKTSLRILGSFVLIFYGGCQADGTPQMLFNICASLHLRADDCTVALSLSKRAPIMVNSVTLSLSDEKQIMNGIFHSATLNILLFGTAAPTQV